MSRLLLYAVTLNAALLLGASGCSAFGLDDDPVLKEGAQLDVTDYGGDVPASRAGYATLATFMTTGGGIHFVDPGSGPEDPPRLVRTIVLPNHVRWDAQIDDTGYLWVATPDADRAPIRRTYVIDPHAGVVHRSIELPEDLRAVASLAIGPDEVYLRAWRDGFSGGIGAVSRACVTAARACSVRLVKELGDVGTTPERGLRYDTEDGSLYSFNQLNSRAERASTLRLDPATGEEFASLPFTGESAFDADGALYLMYYTGAGTDAAQKVVGKFDADTFEPLAEAPVDDRLGWLARQGDRLYLTSIPYGEVGVFDTASLQQVASFPLGATSSPTAAFGFLAPDVLMLNEHAWLNTATGEVEDDAFPLSAAFSQALRHAQGQPLAY